MHEIHVCSRFWDEGIMKVPISLIFTVNLETLFCRAFVISETSCFLHTFGFIKEPIKCVQKAGAENLIFTRKWLDLVFSP